MNPIFEDHYEDLQISPNADQETIERVYRLLAKRYHPDNNGSGSVEKFDIVTKAYKVLTDPQKRAAYDAAYEEKKSRLMQARAQAASRGGFGADAHIRRQILSILYIERRQDPENAGVGLWRLEKLLGWPEKMLEFHTWYLKEKKLVQRTDTGGFAITAAGVDELEKDGAILEKDRLLTEKANPNEETDSIKMLEHISAETADKFEEAIGTLDKKLSANPNNLTAWVFLAYLHTRLGHMNRAKKAADRVQQINSLFSVEEFARTLKFKSDEARTRFREYSKLAGLS
jgi:tetratricopeptide (TPR) repeat protein